MKQQLRGRRKRQYFVPPPDMFDAIQLFAKSRTVKWFVENLEKRKREREREARNERREERRIREMNQMRKALKSTNDADNNDEENDNKAIAEENESLSSIRRDSLKEPKINEESECFSAAPLSVMKKSEERRDTNRERNRG